MINLGFNLTVTQNVTCDMNGLSQNGFLNIEKNQN